MIRNYNASGIQVINHVNTLIETVKLFNPHVVYLLSNSISKQLQKARISRGEPQPTRQQIQFWEQRKQMDLSVIERLSIPYDVFDISNGNWDEYIYIR